MTQADLTSLQNPKIKQLVKLRERRERNNSQQFIIEGYRELLRAHENNYFIQSLFYCDPLFLGSNEWSLIESIRQSGVPCFSCTEAVFHKISYRDRPDGLIAIAPQRHVPIEAIKLAKQNSLFIVAEGIEKPGNLGTILRSSDAAGIDGLIVCDQCTDLFNPNVVRASVGTLFTVPVIEDSSANTLKWLKANNIPILAATPQAKSLYTEVDMRGPIAIAVGTEQIGLSELWMKESSLQVRIPMLGVADSLNVATATTLLLYEAVRQRSHG